MPAEGDCGMPSRQSRSQMGPIRRSFKRPWPIDHRRHARPLLTYRSVPATRGRTDDGRGAVRMIREAGHAVFRYVSKIVKARVAEIKKGR